MYAKLMEGRLVTAPHMMKTPQGDVYNPSDETLTAAGFKPVVYAPYPETGEEDAAAYTEAWREENGQIVQSWAVKAETETQEQSELDALREQVAELQSAIRALMGEE